VLAGREGADSEYPLLIDLFSIERLEKHGEKLAQTHDCRGKPGKDMLLGRLRENEGVLKAAFEYLNANESKHTSLSPASIWLLDNFYHLEAQMQLARIHLPKSYSQELPQLSNGPAKGLPRVYDIIQELILHVDGRVDEGNLRSIIVAYQRVQPLNLGELWAIPIMLRLSLLENIRRIASRLVSIRHDRNLANRWSDSLFETAKSDPKNVILDIADLMREKPTLTPTFIAEFSRRLQNQSQAFSLVLSWMEQYLAEQGQTIARHVQLDSQHHAINQVSISNSIGSLKFLDAVPWKKFVESLSQVESILRGDPSGEYTKMDFATRDQYRHAVERVAKANGSSEENVAQEAIDQAAARQAHVGYYLLDAGEKVRRFPLLLYLGPVILLASALTAVSLEVLRPASWTLGLVLFCLLGLAFSQLGIDLIHWVLTTWVKPKILPRLDYAQGIPKACSTLITVPTLLSEVEKIEDLLHRLEVCYLANQAPNIYFCLLSDYRDAPTETMPNDAELFEAAVSGIRSLNERHCREGEKVFLLLHRNREWNPKQKVWMGKERKRGKLEALNRFLLGGESSPFLVEGDPAFARRIKYVITIDSDTQMPRDTARKLIETMAHPLNLPIFDASKRMVVGGYAILQPRMVSAIPTTATSRYGRHFGNDFGIDPYTHAVSDVYQDFFRQGSFLGKGIYDVEMVDRCLSMRLPDDLILSHDLLEGTYCRSALVSDVAWIDDFPEAFAEDMDRHHRWIRGDWQIASWLRSTVPGFAQARESNPLSLLSKWKILDNLRRSLVPPAYLGLIVASWLFAQPSWLGLALVVALKALPVFPALLVQALRMPPRFPWILQLRSLADSIVQQTLNTAWGLLILPYQAFVNIDAILLTLWRTWVTHKRLLEWKASNASPSVSTQKLAHGFTTFGISPAFSMVMLTVLVFNSRANSIIAVLPLAFWFLSPLVFVCVSRPASQRQPRLTLQQVFYLRRISRKTWRYFETFAGVEDHALPADNYQEAPREVVAHRTSPTNIGLHLLSQLGAYDLGYRSILGFLDAMQETFASLEKLERYHGHFYNWYDTQSLTPLFPKYISSVDSGNLAGHLLTLRSGLSEIADKPVFPPALFRGLFDTLLVIENLAPPSDRSKDLKRIVEVGGDRLLPLHEIDDTLNRILVIARDLHASLGPQADDEIAWWWQALISQAEAQVAALRFLAPWLQYPERLTEIPQEVVGHLQANRTLAQFAMLHQDIADMQERLETHHEAHPVLRPATWVDQMWQSSHRAQELILQLRLCADHCSTFATHEFDLLFDKSRNLLSIGYDVGEHRQDEGHYDLLASESRLASFIGIAHGKLPVDHWFSLGRPVQIRKGKTLLLSWSGSMFEYLMPSLVMPDYAKTLIGDTLAAVVENQIAYGRARGIPWGISESAENLTDSSLNYQYRSFGIPGLGFKRGLADDLVIAPYASALALSIHPEAACANMQALSELGFEGRYGLYEAIDYTTSRLGPDQKEVLIPSFMSHHQGMTFIALVNYFNDQIMPRRFEANPALQSALLLLQERIPKASPFHILTPPIPRSEPAVESLASGLRICHTPHTPLPEVHLLSNGRYHVMLTHAGGGYSRWGDLSVTRWHEDATRDACGTFIYVKDSKDAKDAKDGQGQTLRSNTFQPALAEADEYESVFSVASVEFRRRDQGLETVTEIAVSPEDDVELRRLTLRSASGKARQIEITSYAEVAMIATRDEAAHPAFANLFVQTEIIASQGAILCTRRPRTPTEKNPWMFHLLVVDERDSAGLAFETDRRAFLGRGRSTRHPQALDRDHVLSGASGSVLDPIVSIQCRVSLRADASVVLGFITGIAETRHQALALIEKYQDKSMSDRVFPMAKVQGREMLRQLNVSESDALLFGKLAGAVLYTHASYRAAADVLQKNRKGQSGLWAYGISGDLPIMLLRIGDPAKIEIAAQLIQAQAYWRLQGLRVDLVIWNEDHSGYRQILSDLLVGLVTAGSGSAVFDRTGGVFIRHPSQMSEEDCHLMLAVARLVVSDHEGTLREKSERPWNPGPTVPRRWASREKQAHVGATRLLRDNAQGQLLFFNGWGGFTRDGREYVIHLRPGEPTPMPWVNVIANPSFGTIVSPGGGYTWFENAHEFRLTPWYNDAVSDTSGEALYLRDDATGIFWSPLPSSAAGSGDYLNRHGFGYSVFEYTAEGLRSELTIYVDVSAPIKFWLLKVRNDSTTTRKISTTLFLELVLGESRSQSQMHVHTEIDAKTGALFATNAFNTSFANRVAFLDVSESKRTHSGDRTEFIGRNGDLSNPEALHHARLSGKVGSGLDPGASMQVAFELAPGEEREVVFVFGAASHAGEARHLINQHRGLSNAHQALERVWQHWQKRLGTLQIESPDPAINVLANGWLLYQTLVSRIWGRSGFYQSGGAYGFRDQLQDVMALLFSDPHLAKEHILRSAAHQFREGDVQHWWHPPHGQGVRTRISDDFLWLPLAVCEYVQCTGDSAILDIPVTFLEARALHPEEESNYDQPRRSEDMATLYEHCKLALLHGFRFGEHGLPLMGSGDWNDGMNFVGLHGKGESVWLGFFLCHVLVRFEPLAQQYGDVGFAAQNRETVTTLKARLEEHAWDGAWYRRAFFDDGSPLGSATNEECQIDSIAQSWSVLSGVADGERAIQAMQSSQERLFKKKEKIILLLDPPFNHSLMEPGYIKGYVPGVRENGGQYTHAAIWSVMALAKLGDKQAVADGLAMINPVYHSSTPDSARLYGVEPYVMAADVYGVAPHAGRGGWTWYTGSAGWMYRLIVGSVIGLELHADTLWFHPCLPPNWDSLKVVYRFKESAYRLHFSRSPQDENPGQILKVVLDGEVQSRPCISLRDDGNDHSVAIVMPAFAKQVTSIG
jgi:cyclic beta-1,2-glucan synthetase